MQLHRSGEDYLKSILILQQEHDAVRCVEIAERLGVSRPSVTRAVKLLQTGGLLDVDADRHIRLTEPGLAHAEQIYERHRTLAALLRSIGVDDATAEKDACQIEHGISQATFEKIRQWLQNVNARPPEPGSALPAGAD